MPNVNCLAGMRCPKCKSLEPFNIIGTATFKIFDDGSEEIHDISWMNNNSCSCSKCSFIGEVHDFKEPTKKKIDSNNSKL